MRRCERRRSPWGSRGLSARRRRLPDGQARRPSPRRRARARSARRAAPRAARRRRWRRPASPAALACGRPARCPRRRRAGPASTCATSRRGVGTPRASSSCWRDRSSRFCAGVLPKPIPGRRRCAPARRRPPRPRRPARRGRRRPRRAVGIVGLLLHRARRAAHVHQADAAGGVRRHRLERARRAQGADVVDDVGAEVERRPHDFGLGGVDRDRAAEADRLAQHRQHPRELGLEVDRIGPGPARFAAQVEDVGAFGEQPLAGGEGTGRSQGRVAVGERVGRQVDDRHHARLRRDRSRSGAVFQMRHGQ